MKFTVTNPKITPRHLSMLAVIYIRRSSLYQVKEHKASGDYQRSFSELARSYGWEGPLIKEVDIDDGKSGTDTTKREGFKSIRQQVFEGMVGAIFCWEASRLGRDNSDFAQLIKLCAAYDTLIVDEKGVYDPNNTHDRIYLGMMSVLNEAESRRTGDRSRATKRMKAEAGELRLRPATGYLYDNNGKLMLDPRKNVQKAIRLFFSLFDRYGSATKVIGHFNRNKIKFPRLERIRGAKSEIVWGEIDISRALHILRNPMYAGTYAFGLTKTSSEMIAADASEQKRKKIKLSLDSGEPVVIHGSHEGYVTWEKYKQNQKILENNRYLFAANYTGAVRDGSALLQGIVVCGKCLGRMSICYKAGERLGRYTCRNEKAHFGKLQCQTISTRRLDAVVTDALLKAVSTAQLQLTVRELREVERESQADSCSEQEELESAKTECNEARARFDAINPLNTLVFSEYEEKLQEKMAEVKRLEKKCNRALKKLGRDLSDELLRSLETLPQDLRAFWECAQVTNAERKQLLRCLIRQVIIKRRESSEYQDVIIHWVTGATTSLTIIKDGRFLHPEAVKLMRKLAPDHTVTQIIDRLHEAGFTPTRGYQSFSQDSVVLALRTYGIKLACPEMPQGGDEPRGDGRYAAPTVARMFDVSLPTIYRWCEWGLIDGIRKKTPNSAYWVKITPEQVTALKNRPAKRISRSALVNYLASGQW